MKKTLMVLTFALCATFVFAQTMTPRMKSVVKASAKPAQVQNDYRSSIFTKDATPLFTCDFHADNVDYSTGVILGGLEGHAENYDYAQWQRIPNSDSATIVGYASTYAYLPTYFGSLADFGSYLSSYMDTSVSSSENGFMMMSLIDQRSRNSGNFNAYILFEDADCSTADRVDVRFYQYYRKYYDYCYVDYSINNGTSWTEVEINVRGIDIDVNGSLRGFKTYSLPIGASNAPSLDFRIRYKSLDSSREVYGYFWCIDDVSLVPGETNRMVQYAEEYVEGGYAQIPQGMSIDPAWYATVLNSSSFIQNNANAKLYHLPATMDVATEFDSYNNGPIAIDATQGVFVDRGGWLLPDSLMYRGWYSWNDGTPHGSGTFMPTNTPGDNYMYATVSTDSLTLTYDTMFYEVTTAFDANHTLYRWGHDNGVLTYSPSNHWIFGYIQVNNRWYVSENPEQVHYYTAGYQVTNRYTTGNEVPTDWVIHGVEMVASPVKEFYQTGSKISGVLYQDQYDGSNVGFSTINTGANVKEITSSDVNDSNIIGRNTAGYLTSGNYNTVYIPFPEQPALEPNTSYRVGYAIEEDSYFALAQEAQGSYRMASPTRPEQYDTIIYFANNEATAKYATFFVPNSYQTYIVDPTAPADDNSTFAGPYVPYNPMIRMIVGPRQEVERRDITVTCEGDDFGEVAYAGLPACGETIHPVQGSTATVTGMSYPGCIGTVLVDGAAVEPWNGDEETGDPNFIVRHDTSDNHYVYQYSFPNITEDHNISFSFEQDTTTIGFDPIAASVVMNLQPNPATSQVNLNIQGVNGMVNCMLIDMSGRVVYNQNINAETSNVINLNSLAKGAYFVRITNDKFSKVEKLIVR